MSKTSFTKETLISNKGNVCCNCGDNKNIEFHHIVPLSLGGKDILTNIVPLCNHCHSLIHKVNMGAGALGPQSEKFQKALKEGRVGRPKIKMSDNFLKIYNIWKEKNITATEAAKCVGVSRATWYRMVERQENNK